MPYQTPQSIATTASAAIGGSAGRRPSAETSTHSRNHADRPMCQRCQNPRTLSATIGQRKFSGSRTPNIRAIPTAMSA
jgi:hypothetical protein